eukprot:4370219-Ditylum_brightwellii.AAC.1
MIPEVTSLHFKSLGLPEEAVKCSVLLNHNMCHPVKTATGVSSKHYMHKPGNKKDSEGQGKTSSPSNWPFQISTMLSALHRLVLSINMVSVCKNMSKTVLPNPLWMIQIAHILINRTKK